MSANCLSKLPLDNVLLSIKDKNGFLKILKLKSGNKGISLLINSVDFHKKINKNGAVIELKLYVFLLLFGNYQNHFILNKIYVCTHTFKNNNTKKWILLDNS